MFQFLGLQQTTCSADNEWSIFRFFHSSSYKPTRLSYKLYYAVFESAE